MTRSAGHPVAAPAGVLAGLLLFSGASLAMLEVTFDKHPDGPYTDGRVRTDWKGLIWNGLADRALIVPEPVALSGKCLEMKYPAGSVGPGQGGGQFNVKLPPRDEYFLEYWLKFKEGFDFRLGGKLPGLTGGKSNTGGNKPTGDGWSARYMWKSRGGMILYLYNLDQKSIYGDNLSCNTRFETGRWYRLVQRIRVNTPELNDGIAQVWVDGKLVLDRKDIRYRNIDGAQVDHFYFSTFHGGNNRDWAPKVDSYAYFDGFRIHPGPEIIFAKPKAKRKKRKPIILPDGTEIVIVGGIPIRRRPKRGPSALASGGGQAAKKGQSDGETPGGEARRRRRARKAPAEKVAVTVENGPQEAPEIRRLLKEAETLFIDGELEKAADVFSRIVEENPDTSSAGKAREYLDLME